MRWRLADANFAKAVSQQAAGGNGPVLAPGDAGGGAGGLAMAAIAAAAAADAEMAEDAQPE